MPFGLKVAVYFLRLSRVSFIRLEWGRLSGEVLKRSQQNAENGSTGVSDKVPYVGFVREDLDSIPQDVGLQHHHNADQNCQSQTMPKNGAQDRACIWAFGIATGGDTCHDNALRIDHLAHNSARAVR